MSKFYLYGASGHGKVIADIAEENKILITAVIDKDIAKKTLLKYPVIHSIPNGNLEMIIAIGNNEIRKKIVIELSQVNFPVLIHPKSSISKYSEIHEGTVIMSGVSVNPGVVIGEHSIINTNASVDHDCVIDDFVHISPNVALAGNVKVGEGTHVGIGASVIQGVEIGKWCTIGAGSVIIQDVPDYAVVVGNPGKVIKYSQVK